MDPCMQFRSSQGLAFQNFTETNFYILFCAFNLNIYSLLCKYISYYSYIILDLFRPNKIRRILAASHSIRQMASAPSTSRTNASRNIASRSSWLVSVIPDRKWSSVSRVEPGPPTSNSTRIITVKSLRQPVFILKY